MSRCTGHCCKKFWFGPEMVAAVERNILQGPDKTMYRDSVYIKEMLIQLPPQDLDMAGEPVPEGGSLNYFTCKHYDEPSGNCSAYEARPKMCSEYPSYGAGHECEVLGCTAEGRGVSEKDRFARDALLSKYQTLTLDKSAESPS